MKPLQKAIRDKLEGNYSKFQLLREQLHLLVQLACQVRQVIKKKSAHI